MRRHPFSRDRLLAGAAALVFGLFALTPASAAQPGAEDRAPDVERVQRAALRYHGLDGQLDRWSRRARMSNLIPQVELRTTWQLQRDQVMEYREDQLFDELNQARLDAARNELEDSRERRDQYGVRLRFDLGGLVFDRRELQAQREARALAREHRALLLTVTQLYHERRRELARLRELPEDEPELRRAQALEVERCEAELDALTGGWFSRNLRAARRDGEEVAP